MAENHYKTLGIATDANEDTIKDAYRHLVQLYHPDISTDPNASAKIIKINTAYAVLKDPIKRTEYDIENGFNQPKKQTKVHKSSYTSSTVYQPNFGPEQQKPIYDNSPLLGSDSFSFDAVFSAFEQEKLNNPLPSESNHANHDRISQYGKNYNHKDPTKGKDRYLKIKVDLDMVYKGGIYKLTTNIPTRQKNGSLIEETKTLYVDVPKGILNEQYIGLKNMGNASHVGGENGDLYLQIKINTPRNTSVKQADVYQTIKVTPWEALFGVELQVETFVDRFHVSVPKNCKPNQIICFENKGIPAQSTGNLYFVIQIENPDLAKMDVSQIQTYQLLQKLFNNPKN